MHQVQQRRYILCVVATLAMGIALANPAYREFDTSELNTGRAIWLDNCEGCHAYGYGGAPIPMQPIQWKPRVLKNRQTLYQHAIEGFYGPDDSMMPARGGNAQLSDTEVKAAVDYMVALATWFIENEETK